MVDKHTKEVRRMNMSHIRSTNSKPEEKVCKYLFAKGLRYRKNVRKLPGCPDLVFVKYKTVVFVTAVFGITIIAGVSYGLLRMKNTGIKR